MIRPPPRSPLFPYTPLSRPRRRAPLFLFRERDALDIPRRSQPLADLVGRRGGLEPEGQPPVEVLSLERRGRRTDGMHGAESLRSEEHTSELQSRLHLVCRLL